MMPERNGAPTGRGAVEKGEGVGGEIEMRLTERERVEL